MGLRNSINFCPSKSAIKQEEISDTIKPLENGGAGEPFSISGVFSDSDGDLNMSQTSVSINPPIIKDSTREILSRKECKTYRRMRV